MLPGESTRIAPGSAGFQPALARLATSGASVSPAVSRGAAPHRRARPAGRPPRAATRRRSRQDASTTRKYVWDAANLLVETDGDGTTVAQYTFPSTRGRGVWPASEYGPVVSQRGSSTSRFYHPNDLGTFDTVTEPDAATTDTYILDAWGVQHAASGSTTNPFRYIGALGYFAELDVGIHDVRARWLRPATGSWLSVDPVEGEMRYGYSRIRPVDTVDLAGMAPHGGYTCADIRQNLMYWGANLDLAMHQIPPDAAAVRRATCGHPTLTEGGQDDAELGPALSCV